MRLSPVSDQPFDGAAAIFLEYAQTLRGYIRYQLVQRNLKPFMGPTPLRVLDLGGGSGTDAAWLAGQGHQVTFVETSQEQCNNAQSRFNFFLKESERQCITIICGKLIDLPKATKQFDVVLVHGVAMYQAEPFEFVSEALKHVKAGGLISLLEKGYYGAEARAIRRNDMDQLAKLQTTKRFTNTLQLEAYAFTPQELEQSLQNANFQIEQWSGVRVITDEMDTAIDSMDESVLQAIVEAEYHQGQNPSIRGQGQMLHFIARKQ